MTEVVETHPPSNIMPRPSEGLHFTGNAREYFGIWIVNLLLTIITLGIYSPWAKVRRLQYFYRHTELAGSSFDFHGSPIRILIGRAIAVAMLIAYNAAVQFASPFTLVLLALFAVFLPWLLRNSFRFRLHNTSWRGTRFHFRGTLKSAYRVFLVNGFLAIITLYLMAPFMHQRMKAYQHNNSWFGNTRFSFHARIRDFYLIYLLLFVGVVAFVIVAGAGVALLGVSFPTPESETPQDPLAVAKIFGLIYAVALAFAVLVWPAFSALVGNLIWNNTRIGEHRITCRMSPWRVIWIAVSNLVIVVLSLGLMIPWAAIRWARYRVESMALHPAGSLQEFTTGEAENVSALGEETASVFDFDIAL